TADEDGPRTVRAGEGWHPAESPAETTVQIFFGLLRNAVRVGRRGEAEARSGEIDCQVIVDDKLAINVRERAQIKQVHVKTVLRARTRVEEPWIPGLGTKLQFADGRVVSESAGARATIFSRPDGCVMNAQGRRHHVLDGRAQQIAKLRLGVELDAVQQ